MVYIFIKKDFCLFQQINNKAAPAKPTLNGTLNEALNCGLNHLRQLELRRVTLLLKASGRTSTAGPTPAPLRCSHSPRFICCTDPTPKAEEQERFWGCVPSPCTRALDMMRWVHNLARDRVKPAPLNVY